VSCTWSALNTTLGSDHCPTFLSIGEPNASDEGRGSRTRWVCKKADWSLYRTLCKDLFTNNLISEDVNEFNNKIIGAILAAATGSIPQSSGRAKGRAKLKPLPYWTADCSNALKIRNTARNKFNRSRDVMDGARYRMYKGIAQRTVKQAARQHWQSLCSTFDRNTKLGAVWRMSKKMQGKTG